MRNPQPAQTRHALRRLALLWSSLALGLTLSPARAAEAPSLEDQLLEAARTLVGTPAPTPTLQTVDGDTLALGELLGDKAIYVKFWATWCVPCRQQMPHFENVYQEAGEELAVIALNAGFNDSLPDILDYREELGIHMPIVVDDGTLAGAFNLRITPQHVVIGKDGLIKHVGHEANAELDAVLERERNAPDQPAATARAALTALPLPETGDQVPAATLELDGQSVSLQAATAQGSVLVFMIPWCESYLASSRPAQSADCRAVREQVEALKQEQPGLRWLGIAGGIWTVQRDLTAYTADYGTTLPLALDREGQLFRSFGIRRVPTVIVTDAAGRIVRRVEGHDATLGASLPAQ